MAVQGACSPWTRRAAVLPAEFQLSLRQLLEGAQVASPAPQLLSNKAIVASKIAASISAV